MQASFPRGRAGRALEDVQGVLARVAQRPQLTGRGNDRVQRRNRQAFGDPAGCGGDPGPDVTAVRVGLLGDQREVAFGVGVAEDQAGVGAELPLSSCDSSPNPPLCAIMRPCMANGWVFCTVRPPVDANRTCATNVEDSACLASRVNSWSRNAGSGCLSSTGSPAAPKKPKAGAVGVAVTLHLQRIGGVQQPERRLDPLLACGQPEQAAHNVLLPPTPAEPTAAPGRLACTTTPVSSPRDMTSGVDLRRQASRPPMGPRSAPAAGYAAVAGR